MAKAAPAATQVAPVATVPEKSNTAVAATSNTFDAFEQFAGGGMEKLTAKDVLIPRLTIIQALSDQKKKTHINYIEDCDIGDIVDAATNEIMPRPLHFVPVVFDKVWLEWYPRTTRKGLANIHKTDDCLADTRPNERGQPIMANGNYIAETAQIYGINLLNRRPCFIAFTSSQLKKVRRWMTLANSAKLERRDGSEYTAPLFFRTYTLDTLTEQNAEGEWAGWVIERDVTLPNLPNYQKVMAQAIEFRDQIAAGIMRGDVTNLTDDPGAAVDGVGERVPNDPNGRM